jgi:hypothetical protein
VVTSLALTLWTNRRPDLMAGFVNPASFSFSFCSFRCCAIFILFFSISSLARRRAISSTAFWKSDKKSATMRSSAAGLSTEYFSPKKAHMPLRASSATANLSEAIFKAWLARSLKSTITSRNLSFRDDSAPMGTAAFRISSSTWPPPQNAGVNRRQNAGFNFRFFLGFDFFWDSDFG